MEELWKKKLVAAPKKEKGIIWWDFDFPHRFPLAFSMWKTLKNREFTLLLAKNGEFSTFDKFALSTPSFPLWHKGKRFFSPHPFFNSQRVFHTVFNICGKLVERMEVFKLQDSHKLFRWKFLSNFFQKVCGFLGQRPKSRAAERETLLTAYFFLPSFFFCAFFAKRKRGIKGFDKLTVAIAKTQGSIFFIRGNPTCAGQCPGGNVPLRPLGVVYL